MPSRACQAGREQQGAAGGVLGVAQGGSRIGAATSTHAPLSPTCDYPHRIEYYRVLGRGERIHEYTEVVTDAGWCFRRAGMTRDEWLGYYTRVCATDYLDRTCAAPGRWLVVIDQQRGDERRLLCSITMTHQAEVSSITLADAR